MKRFPILSILLIMTVAASCNRAKESAENPFFSSWDTPFGVPPFDSIRPEHYIPAFEEGMARHRAEIDSIVGDTARPAFDNVILRLDRAGAMLLRVETVFGTVAGAARTEELKKIDEKITPRLSEHYDGIMLDQELFAKVREVYDNRASLGLDAMQLRLTEKTYKRFLRAGAALDEAGREKLSEINTEIARLRVAFSDNVLGENDRYRMLIDTADLDGLPSDVREAAAAAAVAAGHPGRFAFGLGKPSLIPFLTFSEREDLRERLYTAYLERCSGGEFDNYGTIKQIARLRNERARLLGYESHAAYVLDDRMAATPQNVYELLDELWGPALQRASEELEEMKAIKKSETGSDDFASWDWWYYARKLGKEKYDLDESQIRPYLSVQSVRDGIFNLCNRLYGLTFRPLIAPVYHSDCQVYEVFDNDNSHLGVLYMDYYAREGKRQGTWCGAIRRQGYDANGNRISPVVSIVCNFPPAGEYAPSLLGIDDVLTFFHEFGHAVNHFVAEVPYDGLYGYEYDMVELPSQIMENWALDPRMLRSYAFHYRDNRIMPDHLIERITRSRLFNQGFATVEYLAASYIDMDLYSAKEPDSIDPATFGSEALARRGLIPQIEPRYRYPYFLHIFSSGYDAGYYGYIWAEVLDKDAYRAFVESGDIFDRKTAQSFRRKILSKRGTVDGMEQYRAFRGQEPSRLPLMVARGMADESLLTPEPEPEETFEPETDLAE